MMVLEKISLILMQWSTRLTFSTVADLVASVCGLMGLSFI